MGPKLLYSRQCTSFTMNKTKTNSHFLPMEKLFLLFTFSSSLPSQLHCGQDGIAEDGGGGTAAASTYQGEQD